MSFIAAAAIIGGAGVGAAALSRKSGGGGVGFEQVPETKEATAARKRLFQMATGPLPEIPRRGVAPLPPITEERQLARTTAKELIQPQDIFALPEVQGIIQEATLRGDLLANRLGRSLQAAGSLTSTPGRDILGRAVTDVQKNLASSLAPFAAEERRRRTGLIPVLEALGLTEEERGRGVTQAELDALFQQLSTETQLPFTFQKPLLEAVLGNQPAVQPIIQGEQPSFLTQIAPLIGPLLAASLMGGGGAGGNIAIQGSSFTNPMAVFGAPPGF